MSRKKFIEENKIHTNYTTIFLLPMLEYSRDFFKIPEFTSAYLIDEEESPKIVLVFENTDSEDLKELLLCIQSHEEFITLDTDEGDVLAILTIPRQYQIDYNMFKIGRYSKFDNNFKELLLDAHGRITGDGDCIMMVDALFPNHKAKMYRAEQIGISINDLPNGEVMSVPDLSKEMYKPLEQFLKEEQLNVNNN